MHKVRYLAYLRKLEKKQIKVHEILSTCSSWPSLDLARLQAGRNYPLIKAAPLPAIGGCKPSRLLF